MIGDMNSDGKKDIVSTNLFDSTISVRLRGDTGVALKIDFAGGQFPNYLALGDMNGDGALDVVTTNTSPLNYVVSVILGTKTGALDAAPIYRTDRLGRRSRSRTSMETRNSTRWSETTEEKRSHCSSETATVRSAVPRAFLQVFRLKRSLSPTSTKTANATSL